MKYSGVRGISHTVHCPRSEPTVSSIVCSMTIAIHTPSHQGYIGPYVDNTFPLPPYNRSHHDNRILSASTVSALAIFQSYILSSCFFVLLFNHHRLPHLAVQITTAFIPNFRHTKAFYTAATSTDFTRYLYQDPLTPSPTATPPCLPPP